MKIVMRKMTRWGDKLYRVGHEAVVSEEVGKRWVSRGLAYEIKVPEKVQEVHDEAHEVVQEDLNKLTYQELRTVAKEKGISTYGKKRDEIVEALNGDYDTSEGEAGPRD